MGEPTPMGGVPVQTRVHKSTTQPLCDTNMRHKSSFTAQETVQLKSTQLITALRNTDIP